MDKRLSLALAAAFLLTGCAGPSEDDRDKAFLSTVREALPATAAKEDAKLIALGHAVCDDFKSGSNQIEVLTHLQQASPDVPTSTWGSIVGASTAAYCPGTK